MNEKDLSFLLSECFKGRNSFIYYLYALYPGSDVKVSVSFISSFCMLVNYLEMLCLQCRIKDEPTLRQVLLAVLDATEPGRDISNYCKYFHTKGLKNILNLLVETCRNQVARLPSYDIVLEQLKKYIYYYLDLTTYKFISSEESRSNYILTWADYYIRQFPSISTWEFSSSANSLMCILALFSSAFDPLLGANTVKYIESLYFPWICALDTLLRNFLRYNRNILEGAEESTLNFAHNYKNLKECEDRLAFFINSSLNYPFNNSLDHSFDYSLNYPLDHSSENCPCPDIVNFHKSIVKWMLAIYLSDPGAKFGFNRIASYNLLKLRNVSYKSYYTICKIIGFFL